MRPKETQERRPGTFLNSSLLAATLATALVGCVVTPEDEASNDNESPQSPGGGAPEDQTDERGFIATSYTTSTELGAHLEIRLRPLELLDGETLKLSMEVSNVSDEGYTLRDSLSDSDNMYSASNTSLIDPVEQTRHLNNELRDGSCYCTFANEPIASGESVDLEVMFPPPPENTETMTVTTPITAPFFDIPITESNTSTDEEYSDGDILPLTMTSDEGDTGWSEQESEEERSILLSSDVLFEFDSAELTSDADEIIEQVAGEINQSNSETVTIEGYTDNQGPDSVNIPLSQERAESVESTLSDLAAQDGIDFETEGHGSSDPVADNETEEGQELNRRVTVTFEK